MDNLAMKLIHQTYNGTLYHLTPSQQKYSLIQSVILSIGDIIEFPFHAYKQQTGNTGLHYLNLHNYETYLSNIKSNSHDIMSISDNLAIKIKQRNGYHVLNVDEYHRIDSSIQSDHLIALTEDNSSFSQNVSKKGQTRSSFKTIASLKQSTRHKMILPIVDSSCLKVQQDMLDKVKDIPSLEALMLLGFNNDQLLTENGKSKLAQTVQNVRSIPAFQNIPLILMSNGSIIEILIGLQLGIKQFITQYAFVLAKKGILLDLDLRYTPVQNTTDKQSLDNQQIEYHQKREKQMDLNDTKYRVDDSKLTDHCDCFSCQQHTKMYVHHLLNCNEMTGNVLLTIHNCYQMGVFQKLVNEHQQNFIDWFVINNLID